MKPLIDGRSIDREVAEETPCPECGAQMRYDPRQDVDDRSRAGYHAWAVCTNPDCEHEFEF
jgi:hypothetical protein